MREDADAARTASARRSRPSAATCGSTSAGSRPGDRWEEEILSAIRREVRLFVPLISKNTESREEGYVFKEWGEAVDRAKAILRRRFIVPVVIDPGYDGNPAGYRQMQEGLRTFQFGFAPAGQPDANLLTALTEEIRAMRRKEEA